MSKKAISTIVVSVIAILAVFIGGSFLKYNNPEQDVLVVQFGEVVSVKDSPGIFFKIPVIQSTKNIYVGERLYDVPTSEVITSDKKSMIANCYVTWKIDDSKKYYQTLSSESVAQGRIDIAVYNAMKNVISSTKQAEVISGKDGSLGETICKRINLAQYGITITKVEMKLLDLPDDNKEAVYNRMISERQAIAAEYTAQGEKESKNIRSATDTQVRTTVSEAQVVAANIEADAEKEYFQILSSAYSSSEERKEFYNFIVGLDALKESLKKGGTIAIDETSPLYDILNNR